MTLPELRSLADRLDLCGKEFAYLLGVSERSLLRGVRDGGTADILARSILEGLDDPQQALSVRAAAIMSARSGGLETYLRGTRRAYVNADLDSVQGPRPLPARTPFISQSLLDSVLEDDDDE